MKILKITVGILMILSGLWGASWLMHTLADWAGFASLMSGLLFIVGGAVLIASTIEITE